MEDDYFNKAYYTVLQNSSLVHPYIVGIEDKSNMSEDYERNV